ncbi:MAG TPA: hypothetical protein VE288_18540 [Rubrobacteraceae bacterium]|nr:hypothetical protein [Rubrobacteraceae bacterium]
MEKVIALLTASLVNADHFDAVAPIPLYRTRLARRGFNQVELMAKSGAARINVPVSDKLKVVCRITDQVELSAYIPVGRTLRAPSLREGLLPARSSSTREDVFTSGTTLSECATVLKKMGAVEVHALSLCRTC